MHVYKFKVVDFSRHFHVHFLVNTFEGPRFLSTFLFVFELSAKHSALRSKSKDWLARNQDNVFQWSYMSARKLLFQWSSTMKIQLSVLV